MKPRVLPLTSKNFGEWLASLGLLELVAVAAEETPALSFDKNGAALLHSSLSDKDLISLLKDSATLSSIRVQYYTPPKGKAASAGAVTIGNDVLEERSFTLASAADVKAFETTPEPKDGCAVGFDIGRGISVRHFVGKALCELADLRSPVKTWSGRVEFPKIFLSIREKVAANAATTLDEFLASSSRETQRLRFDHAWEDYFDDGCASLEEGAQMRPAVEWLAFLGLSFFPPEWGWDCLSPQHNRLRTRVWSNPLDATATTLALHSGQLTPSADFQVVVGGQFEPKKIRFLSTIN
jgi:hypothetical protein